jgi:cell wall assembly regulator SMI1
MIRINLTDHAFTINDVSLEFPIGIKQLNDILGNVRFTKKTHNQIYTWDRHGILAYSKNGESVESLLINLAFKKYEFSPKQNFCGELKLNSEDAISYYNKNKEKRIKLFEGDRGRAIVLNGISFWFDLDDKTIKAIEIQQYDKPLEKAISIPLSVDEEFNYLKPLWIGWIEVIESIVSNENDYYNLAQGITNEDIKNYSRLDDNITLPRELINFYKIHNVDYDPVTSAFSFSQNNLDYELIPFKDIKEEWQGIQDLQFGDSSEADNFQYSEKVKASNYANPNWIPFATGRNGDYLLYDTDPSDHGTYGQIIELQNESSERHVVAKSITELIQNEISMLKDGEIKKYDFILRKNNEK